MLVAQCHIIPSIADGEPMGSSTFAKHAFYWSILFYVFPWQFYYLRLLCLELSFF